MCNWSQARLLQGIDEGRKQGIDVGRKQMKHEMQLETIQRLMAGNADLSLISMATGLSEKQILAITQSQDYLQTDIYA